MTNAETISNFLLRDGTSQEQRSLEALGALYARMDARRTEELLSLIYRYARYVFYYRDNPESPEGDWQAFFSANNAFRYAAIQQFNSPDLEKNYATARQQFIDRISAGSFWPLFYKILQLALQLNSWLPNNDSESKSPFEKMLEILIHNDFSKALARLIAVANTFTVQDNVFTGDLETLQRQRAWQITPFLLIARDTRLSKLDPLSRRRETETLKELDDLFQTFYKGMQQVQRYTLDNFQESITGDEQQEPHVGLLLTFINLFLMVRDGKGGMNDITRLHQDFFYKDILQLKKRPHQPDHVHFLVELSKQINTFLLTNDMALKNGKDLNKKEIRFFPENEIVYNRATVVELRTIFKDKRATLFAAPVANSADGLGAAFQDPKNNSWPTLGADIFRDKNNTEEEVQLRYPFARTGFVLSSPVLLLNEGTRTILLKIKLGNLEDKSNAFSNLLSKRLFQIDALSIAAFEKAGIVKEIITILRDKIQSSPDKRKWIPEEEFEDFTGISGPLLQKARIASFSSLFSIYYSTAKGWQNAPLPSIVFDATTKWLSIGFILEPTDKAFAPPAAELQATAFPLKDPGIKIIFNHLLRHSLPANDTTPWYDIMSQTTIDDVFINVRADNVKNLVLANDEGLLDGNKKFFPFTAVPKIQSNFFIGSNELFRKKLTGMRLTAEWDGLPSDFKQHYSGYEDPPPNNVSFTASVDKLVNGSWQTLPNQSPRNQFKLFTAQPDPPAGSDSPVDTRQTWIIQELEPLENVPADYIDLPVPDQPQPLTTFDNTSVEGFIRLKLERHFYHEDYPFILASMALSVGKIDYEKIRKAITNNIPKGVFEQSQDVDAAATVADLTADSLVGHTPVPAEIAILTGDTEDTRVKASNLLNKTTGLKNLISSGGVVVTLPKPPYTPAIKSFYVDYTASAVNTDISFLHLYSFEEANHEVLPIGTGKLRLLPEFNEEGSLLIGLKNVTAGSNLSLLFQLADFSADPDIEAAPIKWYYLKNNSWINLKKDIDIISDSTKELLVSGIVNISIPWDANTDHTLLPAGHYWLKVATPYSSAAVCEAKLVAAQAGVAAFRNEENDLGRLSQPLAENSIAGLSVPRSEIKKIKQPYPSFGGRKEEEEKEFYTRVSERLKHKGRAISVFDYERMTLEAFPSVFKVKCIPHTKICRSQGAFTTLQSPGWVTLALIPEIKDFPSQTRLQPKLSRIVLKEVEDFFLDKTSGFVMVQTINPIYAPVNFKGKIRFHPGKDEAYYIRLLGSEVRDYLSPWIKGSSRDIVFGGTLMMSSVLRFIELRPYVSFVTEFEMNIGNGPPVKIQHASTPSTVLIAGEQNYRIASDECKSVKKADQKKKKFKIH